MALSLKESEAKKQDSKSLRITAPVVQQPKVLFQVKALYDFPGYEEGELGLQTGQIVDVYDSTTFHEWWKGGSDGKVGIFPSNYVQKLEGAFQAATSPTKTIEQTDEAFVQANAKYLDEFQNLLATMNPKDEDYLNVRFCYLIP